MAEVDTSILDELRGRNRRAALRERGARTGRVKVSAPSPLRRRQSKPRVETLEQRQARTAAARAARAAKAESEREAELDLIADALLSICTRLNDEGYTAAPQQDDIVERLRRYFPPPTQRTIAVEVRLLQEAADEIERLRRDA